MSFLETIDRAKAHLERQRRVSVRALRREFALDDAAIAELVDELVAVQQVAVLDGTTLIWGSPTDAHTPATKAAPPEQVAGSSPVAEAERRQLTVMFCDLVGSSTLGQQLDAEDFREIIRGYYDTARTVTDRWSGHVATYMGDGLLVYFGYPQAREDDAERAVRAGLEIVGALPAFNEGLEAERGVRLAVRVGIHTGPVVVGELGRHGDDVALGDTMNRAARIQAAAVPDTVVCSRATLRLVRGIFVTKDLGECRLPGIAGPVRIHQMIQPSGVRSRLDVAETLTHFVGREQELGMLLDRWEQVLEGSGHGVLVSGEAGIGKSRLIHAFRERLAEEPHSWLECRCSAYTQGSALHPVLEVVQQGLAFTKEDTLESKWKKLEDGVALAGFGGTETVPLVAELLGLPLGDAYEPLQLSPELQREKTLDALAAWALALGEIQPLLLLVEDLHWCDPSSLELFGRLVEQVPTSRLLMLLTARPEFEPPRAIVSRCTPVVLGRLRRRQARELVGAASPDRPLPETVVDQIVERADGVPLYLEELTRTAVESGSEDLEVAVPTTLRDSLMARLDRLSAAKDVAQLASALGREFPYALLSAVAELGEPVLRQGLARLVDAGLLFQRGTPPQAHYIFKHALIQDTAHQSLLRSKCQELHARIAQALEDRFPERAQAEPEVVGRHYDEAGLAREAIAYYSRAATKSQAASAHREAISHLERSLELLPLLTEASERDDREIDLRIGLGVSLQVSEGHASPLVSQTYERAASLCNAVRDPNRLAPVLYGLATFHLTHGDLTQAEKFTQQLRTLDKEGEHATYTGGGCYVRGFTGLMRGRFAASISELDAAVASLQDRDPAIQVERLGLVASLLAQVMRSWGHWIVGNVDQARHDAREAMKLASGCGHPYTWSLLSALAATTFKNCGDRATTCEWTKSGLAMARQYGFLLAAGCNQMIGGWSEDEADTAVRKVEEGVAVASGTGNVGLAPYIVYVTAEVNRAAGRPKPALDAIEGALALSDQLGMHFWDAELHRFRGELFREIPGHTHEEVEEELRRALDIARSQEAKSLELRAAASLARLWQRQNREAEARGLLRPVYGWFTEGFDTQDLKDAKALLEELA